MNKQLIAGIVIAAVAFILIGIAMAFGPTMLSGFENVRTSMITTSENDAGDTTVDPASTNASVTLTYEPYAGLTSSVTSVTSNDTSDSPVVNSVSSYTVNVTGLTANATRTLTTTYEYNATPNYTGLSDTVEFGPSLILLGFIITVGLGGFMGIAIAGVSVYKGYKQ